MSRKRKIKLENISSPDSLIRIDLKSSTTANTFHLQLLFIQIRGKTTQALNLTFDYKLNKIQYMCHASGLLITHHKAVCTALCVIRSFIKCT